MRNQTADEIVRRVEDEGVSQVRVIFLDYNGIARARSLPPGSVAGALTRGVNFSSPTVDFNSRDLFPPEPPLTWRRRTSGREPIPKRTGSFPTRRAWRRCMRTW